jgi:hypothetical protein
MASEIHAPAFFEKLSAYGIAPRTQAEADQLLELGVTLYSAESQGQYKSAADAAQEQRNPFLDAVLNRFVPGQQAASDDQIKAAALQAVQGDDIVKAAALVYNHVMSGGELAADEA